MGDGRSGRTVTLWTLAAVFVVWTAWVGVQLAGVHGNDDGFLDVMVYRAGGQAVISNNPLYAEDFATANNSPKGLLFTYPPFSALLFTGLAVIPPAVAKSLMILLNALGCAVLFSVLVLATRGRWERLSDWRSLTAPISRRTGIVLFLASAAFLFSVPVIGNFTYGQVNVILCGAVALDILLPSVPWPRGLLVGLAVAIKLTPAVFFGYFLVTRQWRALAVSVATTAVALLISWLVLPGDTIRYFTSSLFDPGRIGGLAFASNQSLRGVIERIPALDSVASVLWLVSVVLVLALGIIAIEVSRRSGDTVAAMLSAALLGLLCSPVSWGHHWVWLSAAAVYFLMRWITLGGQRNLVAGVVVSVVITAAPWIFLPDSDQRERLWSSLEHLLGAVWPITALLLLVSFATAWTSARTTKDDGRDAHHAASVRDARR